MWQDLLLLSGLFFAVFALTFGVSYVGGLLIKRRVTPMPEPNCKLRIQAASGMYRARFVARETAGWSIEAPMQRDHYVPMRVGEQLIVEATCPRGVLLFRSRVIERRTIGHQIVLEQPKSVSLKDRRQEPRLVGAEVDGALLEGEPTEILDVSPLGAKVATALRFVKGRRVKLELPWMTGPIFGWPLEEADGFVRLRFEERIELPSRSRRNRLPQAEIGASARA